MSTGTVKFFNQTKGFGFITQDQGEDLFVHITELQNGDVTDGDKVEYDLGQGQKGPCAVNVRKI